MLKRLFMVASIALMISVLAGCQQNLDDALGIINQLLDNTSEEADGEAQEDVGDNNEVAEENGETEVAGNSENEDENDGDDSGVPLETLPLQFIPNAEPLTIVGEKVVPIDDRLKNQGYTIYQDPHEMPLPIPYQWILVNGESEPGEFTGYYCFDIPQEINYFATHFDHYYLDQDVQHDTTPDDDSLVHVTTLKIDRDGMKWDASIKYGVDEFDNTCAIVEIDYEPNSDMAIGPIEVLEPTDTDRQRTLPDNYDAVVNEATNSGNFHSHSTDNSVKEAIYNEERAMLVWLARDVPNIFLYDSYLIRVIDTDDGSEWDATMCTDIFPHVAVEKHLELLGNYNANIDHIEVVPEEDNTSMLRVATIIDFSFNDEHGTGSWSGSTYFYRYEDDDTPFSEQRCYATDMVFSPELID